MNQHTLHIHIKPYPKNKKKSLGKSNMKINWTFNDWLLYPINLMKYPIRKVLWNYILIEKEVINHNYLKFCFYKNFHFNKN